MPPPLIGARVPRNEDEPLLRGRGRFVDDMHAEGRSRRADDVLDGVLQ